MNAELYGEIPVQYGLGQDIYTLRTILVGFADLFNVMVSENISGGFKDAVEKLTSQEQVFRYLEEAKKLNRSLHKF